jgi:hypothetical protein
MGRIFEIAAALFAVVAAGFWLLSVYGEMPQMATYWDMSPVDDPLLAALGGAAIMTSWAAGFSGASALCAAARLLL